MLLRAPAAAAATRAAARSAPSRQLLLQQHRRCRGLSTGVRAGAAAIRRVGIVGAGPSAFYAAKFLLKELGPQTTVELIDRCVCVCVYLFFCL